MMELRDVLGSGWIDVSRRVDVVTGDIDTSPAAGPDVLREAIEAREVVERAIVRLAAVRRTDQHLERLADALTRMREGGNDREVFNAGDFAFHIALSDAAQNRVLARALASLHGRVREMIDLYSASAFREGTVGALLDSHERLEAAVRRRDADEAPAIMAEMMDRLRDEARLGLAHEPTGSQTNGRGAAHTKGEAS